jgi:hypothetical protein
MGLGIPGGVVMDNINLKEVGMAMAMTLTEMHFGTKYNLELVTYNPQTNVLAVSDSFLDLSLRLLCGFVYIGEL